MSKRLYVGNLSFNTTEDEIKELFGQVGSVESVSFVRDHETGRMKGFGFVDVSGEDADKVIAQFNGKEVAGRSLVVNEARPKTTSRKW
jgi:cold-inducible RNA-binding protein